MSYSTRLVADLSDRRQRIMSCANWQSCGSLRVKIWSEKPRIDSSIFSLGTIIKSTGEITLELLFFWMKFMNAYVLNDQ